MIKEFKKSIGYICPNCSSITVRGINLFDFSGNGATELLCANGKCAYPVVTVLPKKDKYAITVHCPICDEKHLYNIRKISFWHRDFFALNCPESGFGVIFIGSERKIHNEIAEQERIISSLEEDYGVSEDLSIIFEAVEHINALAKDGKISCACGGRNIAIEIDNDFITLFCRGCGAKEKIETSRDSLENLLKISTIVLGK